MSTESVGQGKDLTGGGLRKHKMSGLSVFLMIFCLVAGGYFGIEDMVSASGPGLTIVLLLVFPFFWSIPQALIASELGSAIPDEGGYYVWIKRAFGEFWGFQVGWWRTLSCYVDSTLYVVLASGYISALIPMSGWQAFVIKAVIVLFFTWINYRGIQEVSKITSALMLFVLATLVVFVALGAMHWQYNPVLPFIPQGQTLWQSLGFGIAICIWIYSGYESMGTMSGELENPEIIPKATLWTVPAVIAVYVLPIIFGMASYGNYEQWSADTGVSFVTIVGSFGIPGMQLIFMLGAVACSLSLYNSYLASASRGYYVIAEDKLAPPVLCKVNKKYGTPHLSIFSMAIVNLILAQINFSTLLVIDVVLFMFAYLIWFFAAVALRIKEPNLPRPFKIPLGTKGMIAMTVAPAIICVAALFTNGLNYLIGGCLGLLTGPIFYVLFKKMYGGIDGKKSLDKAAKKNVCILTALILICLAIGGVLLARESRRSTESFRSAYDSALSSSYEMGRSKYVIPEDSFLLGLTDRSNDNATTGIWYYEGALTGDVYLSGDYDSGQSFAQEAFAAYQQLEAAGLDSMDIYSDDYAVTIYDESYGNPQELYQALVQDQE